VWTAAILAGGQGPRLGGCDKGWLQVGDRSILARQIGILRPLATHLFIIGSHAAEQNVRVIDDRIPGSGALGRLYTALARPSLQVRELGPDEFEPFNRDGRLLFNVNTPHDYVSAIPLAKADDRSRLAAERD